MIISAEVPTGRIKRPQEKFNFHIDTENWDSDGFKLRNVLMVSDCVVFFPGYSLEEIQLKQAEFIDCKAKAPVNSLITSHTNIIVTIVNGLNWRKHMHHWLYKHKFLNVLISL